jgi:hypothetical protein
MTEARLVHLHIARACYQVVQKPEVIWKDSSHHVCASENPVGHSVVVTREMVLGDLCRPLRSHGTQAIPPAGAKWGPT